MNGKWKGGKVLCYLAIAFSIIYLCWRAFFTLPLGYGVFSIIMGVLLLIAELVGILSGTEQLFVVNKKHLPKMGKIAEADYPEVDVFIATHNEPVDLLYKTVNGCLNMDYPDKKKVHIYICDDTERVEIQQLATKMNVGYLGVKDNKFAKAGNLNYALANTKSPLVVTFDADMIPLHTFLMDTVPYFYDEEGNEKKVGFVQTPQSFYNADLFQYNLYSENVVPNEQNFFFREINIVRNRTNSPIYAGSNTIISRAALEEVDGIATGLITEDFATGIHIQKKGYKCYATDKVEANGLAPNDIKSLIKQRERWARGCIQTMRRERIIFTRELTLKQKLSYINSLLYWYTPLCRLMYILAPVLFGLFGVYVLEYTFMEMMCIWLPYYIVYNGAIKLKTGDIRNARLSNVYDTIMYPYLIFPIILETLGIKKRKFTVTRKDNAEAGKSSFLYAIPHIVAAVLSILALVRCIGIAIDTVSPYYLIVIFWLIYNLYGIIMSIFFICGRRIERDADRFKAEVDVEVRCKYGTLKGKTMDLADHGFSVLFDFPEYVDDDEQVMVKCYTDRYVSEFKASIVYSTYAKHGFKYAFTIGDIDEQNKRNYLNIVYDREPSLPTKIEGSASIFGEFSSNIHKRFSRYVANSRKLARISLHRKLQTVDGDSVMLYNFNYEYAFVGIKSGSTVKKQLDIVLEDGLSLKATASKEKPDVLGNGKTAVLYKVQNLDELMGNEKFRPTLKLWIEEYREKCKEKERKRKLKERSNNDELDEIEYVFGGNDNE